MRMPDVRPRKRCLTFGRTHRMQSNHRDQRMADAGFHLNPTARHSHGRNGLAGLAARRGFIERLCPRASLRAQAGADVAVWIVVPGRPATVCDLSPPRE
jgi:hypothetical protein